MTFTQESNFEDALIDVLTEKGWEKEVLHHPSEQDLIDNWAKILNDNNQDVDRLNGIPLTNGEMQQILEQIISLKTPLKLNTFINGKTVSITRDNPADTLHFGKEISLKIYDRHEIAAGQSRYQIVKQPHFSTHSKILGKRRGDLLLLINGMPVIHIELKRSGIPISQACNQIENYSRQGVFSGLFSLVQIFVAMTPEEMLYFANPGSEGIFNPDYYFRWADFNNEPINHWQDIASTFLFIPMAHQLIGFYTVADDSDGVLKVMRSYQYFAAHGISDTVAKLDKSDWQNHDQRGGYIWHTTGSGKTLTSFKSAQLIANSKDADKVIFLIDRVELGTQSLKEYRGFAEENESIQATENTSILLAKLKSTDPAKVLIVTSIQKMSNINDEFDGLKAHDLEIINQKRIVFIVDEAHRSTFGDMMQSIKKHFSRALFFGFTGTPIHEENQKKMNTTADIFGQELHRYSIADGIRDKNVLGFDPYKILTFRDMDVRKAIALEKAKAKTEAEAIKDPKKSKIYYHYMDSSKIKMAGFTEKDGTYVKGIEDYLPTVQYRTSEHQNMVVQNIIENWVTLSHNSKFHAIFATSSIPEAIEYFRLFKNEAPELKIAGLFDPHIDNCGGASFKEEGLVELIQDYNERYEQDFTIASHAAMKKDMALRLAHKEHYKWIEREPHKQIDILIVVDQMLTGFDSKWVNTLYLDKKLEYENIIQAFSRTNRLLGPDKPFGTIRYFRKPHTMESNIAKAVKLYSGDKPIGLFVEKLPHNIAQLNYIFNEIAELFANAGIPNFTKLPEDTAHCAKFASLFNTFNSYLEAAKIQGFNWEESQYSFKDEQGEEDSVHVEFTQTQYLILAQRYKELVGGGDSSGGGGDGDVPYDIKGNLVEIDTEAIDADYMNSHFNKYLKLLKQDESTEAIIKEALAELQKSFATLSQEEQKYADIFLRDVQRGDVEAEEGKTLRDYITEYQSTAKQTQIDRFAIAFGLDAAGKTELHNLITLKLTENNINEFGRFDRLKDAVNKAKAKTYFEELEGSPLSPPRVNMKIDKLLREFVLSGGLEV